MATTIHSPEVMLDLHFPKAGLDRSMAFAKQPARDVGDGVYARTTPSGINVRSFEATSNRMRGGSRSGLVKWINATVNGTWVTQDLNLMVGEGFTPPGGSMQASQSGRVVTIVAVSQGKVFSAAPGDTAWVEATNSTGETPPLNFSGILFSAANLQKLWFADGTNWCYFDPHTNTVYQWQAEAGELPVDSDGNTPRLICTWRGRTVLSGLLLDPQNWFMSAVGNPKDFDYSPLSTTPTQAVAGNNSPLGQIGDVITCVIPYTDDVLVVGGDHSISMIRGDPMAGGQIDLISDIIGMAWGQPWCKDPYGNIYFVSNRTGIYTLVPGQQPVRISQPIEQLLQTIDTGASAIRLIWDDRFQGLHVFVTQIAAPAAATHYFYETRTKAWWTDTFANTDHNPLCCVALDGNTASDRAPLIGSWDGFVRSISPTASTDDGSTISSSVVIGPILSKDLDDILLKELQSVLGTASGAVTYEVFVGATAEAALTSTAVVSGTWNAGRNLTNLIRRSGHACYVRLSSTSAWTMESIRARIVGRGMIRRRGM